jgi:rare lipoprotein A
MNNKAAVLFVTSLMLAACGTVPHRKAETPAATAAPSGGGYLPGDGPGADIPVNLDSIPDAVPKNEPLHRYANWKFQGTRYRIMVWQEIQWRADIERRNI